MKNRIKVVVLLVCGFSLVSNAQDWSVGINLKPSFQLNTHRNKQTSIWSSESGYGFSIGIPVKKTISDTRSFLVGLNYEYSAFDNRVNNYLASSTRFHSLNVPIQLRFNIKSDWHFELGTGLKYVFKSTYFVPGNSISIANSISALQPFLTLGVGTILSKSSGIYELGAQTRYHFLDVWNKSYPIRDVTTSNILTFELLLRYFF